MCEIGIMNRLRISRISRVGCFLDGGDLGELMLIRGGQTPALEMGVELNVFVYVDADQSLLATVRQPRILAGQCAALRVVSVTDSGVYLDWNMTSDLFVPRSELLESTTVGQWLVAIGLVDSGNQRMIASTRLYRYLLQHNDRHFEPGQAVELLVCQQTELGFKAVINGTHLGMLYHSEIFQSLSIGQSLNGFISEKLREDGRVDLQLSQLNQASRDDLHSRILQYLHSQGGVSTLTDKSPPDEIYATFSVSKSAYKKALGGLYKKRLIRLDKQQIKLINTESAS